MFWGKRPDDDHVPAPAEVLSGHVDDWEDIAVDYVDGRLDQQTRDLVDRHLAACPDCATRLHNQRSTLAYLHALAPIDAPSSLEDRIMEEVVWSGAVPKPVQVYKVGSRASEPSGWRLKMRVWAPASVVILAVLVGVIGFAVLRTGAGLEGVTTTLVAVGAATTSAGDVMIETTAAGAGSITATTAAMLAGTDSTAAPTATDVPVDNQADPGGAAKAYEPVVQDRNEMIGLASSASPAYFVFVSEPQSTDAEEQPPTTSPESPATTVPSPITGDGDTLITAEQAAAIAGEIKALTGLEPLDDALSFNRPTFAAYVARDHVAQLVDLLRSIGSSVGLAVGATSAPGPAVEEWSPVLMEGKIKLVALSATRTPSPAVSSWTFTTSTLVSESTETTDQPAEPETESVDDYVLVVILVNVLP